MESLRLEASDAAFVDAVARRVVALLREEGLVSSEGPRLLTVGQVAEKYGVSADWLYGKASSLGAIRLGTGPRARLRFDRDTIGVRITKLAAQQRRNAAAPAAKHRRSAKDDGGAELLPILDRRG